jgi:AraC-like DNA-binding protein
MALNSAPRCWQKKHMGTTRQNRRLDLAQRKLLDGDASATDIAMELAFPSSQHFGFTPSAYRRMSRTAHRRESRR